LKITGLLKTIAAVAAADARTPRRDIFSIGLLLQSNGSFQVEGKVMNKASSTGDTAAAAGLFSDARGNFSEALPFA
jgi:hypothetical protein